jgi:hypothetical protein
MKESKIMIPQYPDPQKLKKFGWGCSHAHNPDDLKTSQKPTLAHFVLRLKKLKWHWNKTEVC